MFFYPVGVDYEEVLAKLKVPGRPKVYIIRNSRLDPMYEQVENKLFPIAGRSLDSLIRTQGIGDLYRIYLQTCRDGLEFHLAYIPPDFTMKSDGAFDRAYMQALFDLAYERSKAGYPWKKMPPELQDAPIQCR